MFWSTDEAKELKEERMKIKTKESIKPDRHANLTNKNKK